MLVYQKWQEYHCRPWMLFRLASLYTVSPPKRPTFILWITLSKINRFNDFCHVKSWENLTRKCYTLSTSPLHIGKSKTVIFVVRTYKRGTVNRFTQVQAAISSHCRVLCDWRIHGQLIAGHIIVRTINRVSLNRGHIIAWHLVARFSHTESA